MQKPQDHTFLERTDFMIAERLRKGTENAITGQELCKLLEISDTRKLQILIAKERSEGIPILSSCRTGGYFLPAEGEVGELEIRRFIKTLEAMARHTRDAAKPAAEALRKGEW